MFVFIFQACAGSTIEIKDKLMYGDLGRFGAMETHTLHTEIKPKRIAKPVWDEKRIGMSCTDTENITWYISLVDKFCAENSGRCEYEKLAAMKKAMKSIVFQQQKMGVQFSRESLQAVELE